MIKNILKTNWVVLFFYILIFALVFAPYIKGIGNFWDWGFTVYSDQLKNIFSIESTSWVNSQLGRPLAYTSNYWFRFIISLTGYTKVSSEIILYLLLILISSVSSYFLYLISKTKSSTLFSLIVGLLAILNPAMLYKLVSGHMGYLISYPIFIALTYFLLYKLKKDFKSYLILGLLLAFVGVQIQFFIFTLLVMTLFFLFKRELYSFKYSLIPIVVALLINLPWLSNFIMGVNNVSGSSNQASSVSFSGAMVAKIQNVLVLAFSDATTIKYYFSKPEFVYFGIFSLIIIAISTVYLKNRKSKIDSYLATLWIILFILSTGVFHYLNFVPFKTLSPMFREVGHFAPILILFGLIIIGRSKTKNPFIHMGPICYLTVFGLISAYPIITKLPKLDYSVTREKLQSFYNFEDESVHRIISYPFFGQYSYFDQSKEDVRGRLIENSGVGSYMELSGVEVISNYLQPQELKDSIQYRLVKSYDISELKKKNVKYIYDLSSIWESNFERYSGSEIYNNDLSLIKNDPLFFDKLIENNPGEIVEVEDNIYEIVNTKDRIYGEGVEFEKVSQVKYKVKISNLSDSIDLTFLDNFHEGWKLYQAGNQYTVYGIQEELFNNSHKEVLDYANGWEVDPEIIKNTLGKDRYEINPDGSINIDLVLYFKPQIYQNIGIVLAVFTILSSVGYLIYSKLSNRDQPPTATS